MLLTSSARKHPRWITIATIGCLFVAGCTVPQNVQLKPTAITEHSGAFQCYDSNNDHRADFFMFAGDTGRVTRIGYDRNGDAKADVIVDLDLLPVEKCRHLVIILDGFSYRVVKEYYDSGGLQVFHPPSRVVAPYPSLTDMCLADALGCGPCRAYRPGYYDIRTSSMEGGSGDYLRGDNQPYRPLLTYCSSERATGMAYLLGEPIFVKELNHLKDLFEGAECRELVAFLSTSASVSTREGEKGQKRALAMVDLFINETLWATHGLTKVSMFADHGHSYSEPEVLDIETLLREKGWRLTRRLKLPRDVATPCVGLVTVASLSTFSPAELAADLVTAEGVELASFAQGDEVIVLAAGGGRAVVRRKGDRYAYDRIEGDPLRLESALRGLQPDEDGTYDADELFRATGECYYPDPLERLWRAHFSLVQHPNEVLLSLENDACYGERFWTHLAPIRSTHGSLNNDNSVTFLMSTACQFPPLLRSRDIPKCMRELLGQPWPIGR